MVETACQYDLPFRRNDRFVARGTIFTFNGVQLYNRAKNNLAHPVLNSEPETFHRRGGSRIKTRLPITDYHYRSNNANLAVRGYLFGCVISRWGLKADGLGAILVNFVSSGSP
jgi:hypothetical protein